MSKKISMSLDVGDINNVIKQLQKLSADLKKLGNVVTKEIAEQGLSYLNNEYSNITDQNIKDIKTSVEKKANGYNIVAKGEDVFYEEFGTGDEGESVGSSPVVQEVRSRFSLNDYNSGEQIRNANDKSAKHGIVSGKYWTYKSNDSEEIIYTQGVKPGLDVYNTSCFLKNKAIKNVLKEKGGDVLSKL